MGSDIAEPEDRADDDRAEEDWQMVTGQMVTGQMSAWVVSRRVTAVAVAIVAAAGGVAVAAGGQAELVVERGRVPAKVISITPQSVHASEMTRDGPSLSDSKEDTLRVGFVLPPDHDGQKKPKMRLTYLEGSPGACTWTVSTEGVAGPLGPNTKPNVANKSWALPGTSQSSGMIEVPTGPGYVHTATFTWPFRAKPGMFIQFALDRQPADAGDTCSTIPIVGLEVRY